MKYDALNIHIQLYNNLSKKTVCNNYKKLLQNELKITNLDHCIFSTAEHLAPFNTKNTVSFLIPQLLLQHYNIVEKKDIIILAGSLIPLDNIDYPRGFFLIDEKKKALNLFSQKYKKSCVLLNKSLFYTDIMDKGKDYFFNEYDYLKKIFQHKYENFAVQQAVIMQKIVQKWSFESGNVYVKPLEFVARNILIKLLEEDDVYIKILFNNLTFFKIETYNVFCSWTKNKGTFLFWEVTGNQITRIVYSNKKFIGKKLQFSNNMKEILNLLKENKILPSVSLSLFIVSWLPNISVAGGHRQYWYWQYMIKAYDKMFNTKSKKELSQFGYNQLNFLMLKMLSNYGTGLELAECKVNKNNLFKEVFNLPLCLSTFKDGYYEN